MKEFIKSFPKVELHTHLNGCIREETLNKWHKNKEVTKYIDSFMSPETNSKEAMENCFKSFDLIYEATTTLQRIKQLTKEVLEDYDNENCIILEIRTSPRKLEGHSILDYYNSVIESFKEYLSSRNKKTPFYPYLLFSINRSKLEIGKETIDVANELRKNNNYVKGIELSGNPYRGDINKIIELMNYAKSIDIPFTMHIAEKIDDDEMIKLIECKPLRMGHGIYVNEKGVELMNKYKIDCEICLTSNIVSRSIDKFDNHPIAANKNYKGKLFFCCDDKGLFRTCLTNELFIAFNNYYKDLDESKQKDIIKKLCLDGIKASFLEDNIKKELIEYVESYKL
jgi:adenosine deaminase